MKRSLELLIWPKVIDEDPDIAQVQVAPSVPVEEEMPGLKDTSLKEPLEDEPLEEKPLGEEPQADNPSAEVCPAMPWVRFEAQVCQDEVQYLAAMFMWFHNMYYSWEERKKDDV